MFRKVKPTMNWQAYVTQMPHCDPRVLHAPGECEYCDKHPDWQALRLAWGIAFTNWEPEEHELPCPANHARGQGVNNWSGNVAKKDLAGGRDVSTSRKN